MPVVALKWRQFREWLKYHLEPFDHQHFVKQKQRHLFTQKMQKLQAFCTKMTVQNELPTALSPQRPSSKSTKCSKSKSAKSSKSTKSKSKPKGAAHDDANGVHSGVGQSGRCALHCWCVWLQIPQKEEWLQLIINDGNWFTNCTSELQMMGHETKATERDYWFLRVVEGHSSKVCALMIYHPLSQCGPLWSGWTR